MALANVACLLARRGRNVLVVDWDLEAPGIERYFQQYYAVAGEGPGLLAMLIDLEASKPMSTSSYTLSVRVSDNSEVAFLASGRHTDPDRYSRSLEDFNWVRFFRKGGGDRLETLRDAWKREFDFILIDSRTGLSDSGGVCTIQLPDIVVAMFTANYQSLLGARDVMRYARRARQALPFTRMQLAVVPVPSRFGTSELRESQQWIDRIANEFAEFFGDWLPRSAAATDFLQRIKIPNNEFFSFGERLAVVEQGISDPAGMGFAFNQLARLLENDLHDVAETLHLTVDEISRVKVLPGSLRDYQYDVFISYRHSPEMAQWVPTFTNQLSLFLSNELGRDASIFFDQRELEIGEQFPEAIDHALNTSKVLVALLTATYFTSSWSVAELTTFYEREVSFTGTLPLVFPVVLNRIEAIPRQLSREQVLDLSDVFDPFMKPNSRRAAELSRRIAQLASTVALSILELTGRPTGVVVEPGQVAKLFPDRGTSNSHHMTDDLQGR